MESTKMEKEFFRQQMASLSMVYRQRIDDALVDEYWEHLKKYPQEKLIVALKDIVEIEQFFPSVAVVIKQLRAMHGVVEDASWPDFKDVVRANKSGIAKDSLKLIFKLLSPLSDREPMTKEEFCQGIDELERKYSAYVGYGDICRERFCHGERKAGR